MRAEGHAPAAMDANKGFPCGIQVYGIHRACFLTLPATDAQFFLDDDTAALALGVGSGWACFRTGGWIASQASFGFEARGQAAGGNDANACLVPREILVHEPCAG